MSLLPTNYLQRVAAIGASKKKLSGAVDVDSMDVIAAGFFYDYPSERFSDDGTRLLRRWLVTCKHVIGKARHAGNRSILIRLNYRPGLGTTVFALPTYYQYWTDHPEVDVTVTETAWTLENPAQIQYGKFTHGVDSLTKRECVDKGLFEGDGVFFVGFPTGWEPARQDHPIVRSGVLAQVQGWFAGDHDTYLVDGSGFPGNSGGPVIVKPQLMSFNNFGQVDIAYLIGVVAERRLSEIEPIAVSGDEKTHLEETADLVEVVPVDAINETIERAMQLEATDPDE